MVTVYPADNDKMEYNGNDGEAMTRWNTVALIMKRWQDGVQWQW